MSHTENRGTADASNSQDGRESVLMTRLSDPRRWHRPVVTIIPLKMTLSGSGSGSDLGRPTILDGR
jgi:hypothetical protein